MIHRTNKTRLETAGEDRLRRDTLDLDVVHGLCSRRSQGLNESVPLLQKNKNTVHGYQHIADTPQLN